MKKITKFFSIMPLSILPVMGLVVSCNNQNKKPEQPQEKPEQPQENPDKKPIEVKDPDIEKIQKADEYNIAFLASTLPPMIFETSFINQGSTKYGYVNQTSKTNKAIPTYFWIERDNSVNFDKLPQNFIPNPFATMQEHKDYVNTVNKPNLYEAVRIRKEKFAKYTIKLIKTILKVNPVAKINLYLTDIDSRFFFDFILANNVKNYHLYLLSDGIYTNTSIFTRYNNAQDPSQKHNDDVKNLQEMGQKTIQNKKFDFSYVNKNFVYRNTELAMIKAFNNPSKNQHVSYLLNAYSLSKMPDTISGATPEFKNFMKYYVKNAVSDYNIGGVFKEIQADKTKEEKLKAIYNVTDDVFGSNFDAKNSIVIIGTHNNHEGDLFDYLEVVKKLFPSYKIYYKGHPATPSIYFPQKTQKFKELGIFDVDSTIPFEILSFYYPDLQVVGWTSTSMSVTKNIHALFNSQPNSTYQNDPKVYYRINKITKQDPTYGSELTDPTGYVVTKVNPPHADFDHAIYNPITKSFKKIQ